LFYFSSETTQNISYGVVLIFNKVLWDVESILISTNIALFWYVYVSLLLQNFAVL